MGTGSVTVQGWGVSDLNCSSRGDGLVTIGQAWQSSSPLALGPRCVVFGNTVFGFFLVFYFPLFFIFLFLYIGFFLKVGM